MSTQSLPRRARPRKFEDVVGQHLAVSGLSGAILADKVPPAILLSGHYGCGKTTLARLVAAGANCEHREEGSASPCGGSNQECRTCPGVLEGESNIGAVEELDAASNGTIDKIRQLQEEMSLQVYAKHKVYIIDEAHQLSHGAETALLKTIEEPPEGIIIIMATTEPEKIGLALRSRLTQYPLSALDDEDIRTLLSSAAEKFDIELTDSDITSILVRANNSGRDALRILESWESDSGGEDETPLTLNFLKGMTDAVADSDVASTFVLIAERISKGDDAASILRVLIDHFRNCLIAAQAPAALTVSGPWREVAEHGAERLGLRALLSLVQTLIAANRPNSPDARLALETAFTEVIMRKTALSSGKSGGGARAGLTDGDIEKIADELSDRLLPMIKAEVAAAVGESHAWPPGVADALPPAPRIESHLDEAEDQIKTPLPAPSADEAPTSSRTPFDAEIFLDKIVPLLTRRGALVVERYGELSVSKKHDDVIVLTTFGDRQLSDKDWDAAYDKVKALGWELNERIVRAERVDA